jgi:hypothetical protein
MSSLTKHLENCLPYWEKEIENKEDAYIMAQIQAMITQKFIKGKTLAKELNLTFMPEGWSHMILTELDEEIFSKYFRAKHNYWQKLIHVETIMDIFNKQEVPKWTTLIDA